MGNQKTQAARLPILSASFGGNGSTHWFGQVITNSPQHHLQSPCRAMKVLLLVLLCVMAASCKRGGRGRRGPRECGAGGPALMGSNPLAPMGRPRGSLAAMVEKPGPALMAVNQQSAQERMCKFQQLDLSLSSGFL